MRWRSNARSRNDWLVSMLTSLWSFIQLTRPLFLLGGALMYGLGAAIAYSAGASIGASVPKHRGVGEMRRRLIDLLVQAAQDITREVAA